MLSTDLRKLLADEYAVLKPFIDSTTKSFSQGATAPAPDFSQVPAATPHIDAYVTNGALSKLSLDVGQFDSKVKYSLPVSLSFNNSGPAIVAPTDATLVDYSSLIRAFIEAAPSQSATSSGSGGCSSDGVCTNTTCNSAGVCTTKTSTPKAKKS
jgi:hypothetical protein